jgi:hypothetical protein
MEGILSFRIARRLNQDAHFSFLIVVGAFEGNNGCVNRFCLRSSIAFKDKLGSTDTEIRIERDAIPLYKRDD